MLRVTERVEYPRFEEMIEAEGLHNVLPGVTSIAEGVRVYRQFYSTEQEAQFGVVGLRVQLCASE